jgi:hypothetical protein
MDQLVGPIALYPDPLIALILPAATFPEQIAQANSYVTGGGDPNAIAQQPWDPSVQGLARYPTALAMMAQNMPWTSMLGQVFLNQQQDAMDSVQRLRAQASDLGNLQSSPEDNVISEDGDIEIVPTDPDMLYVPFYDPGVIFFQRPYGRHFLTFGAGFRVGPWLNHDFDWRGRHIVVWGADHPRPAGWWNQRPSQHYRPETSQHATVWHAPGRAVTPVARPGRGWEGTAARGPQPVRGVETRGAAPRPSAPVVIGRSGNTVAGRAPSSAYAGGQSARETRAASTRGAVSRQTAPRPAPAPAMRSPAPASSGGRRR